MNQDLPSRPDGPIHPTRLAILEAAVQLFGEHGFDRTSFKDIAQVIGRPASLVSYHFGTKDNLYLETFKFLFEIFPFTPIQELGRGAFSSREQAAQGLENQLRELVEEVIPPAGDEDPRRRAGAKLWLRELNDPRPELHPLFQQRLSPLINNLRTYIHFLHPELREGEVDNLGATLIGQVVCHAIMRGLNRVIWGEACLTVPPARVYELISNYSIGTLPTGA